MSMPQIPENDHRPNLTETVIDLLESIAMEEMSLSNIMNAEAEKIQAFIAQNKYYTNDPPNEAMVQFSKTSASLLDIIIMKEWILYKKLLSTLEVLYKFKFCKSESYD